MITNGPLTLTVGSPTTIHDPAQEGGNPSVGCQIQNSSPYQLNVLAAGDVLSIQPFTAQTIEISGQPIQVTPVASQAAGAAACVVTFVFLLEVATGGVSFPDNVMVETPPQQDGPLTAAAILATVAASVTFLTGQAVSGPLPFSETFPIPVNANGMVLSISSATQQAVNVTIFGITLVNFTFEFPPGGGLRFFFIPMPILNNGSELEVDISYVSGAAGNVFIQLFAVNDPAVTTTLPGEPLATYKVGGGLLAGTTVNNDVVSILPAPPAGMAYRLQRIVNNDNTANTAVSLVGASSGALYSRVPETASVDNLEGLLCAEGLNVSSTGTTFSVWLFYDLVTSPQAID